MILVRQDETKIPNAVLKAAETAREALEQLPKEQRSEFIKSNSAIWRAFSRSLAEMSHKKCWYSESPEPQSFCDVDHYRPKGEAKRSDTDLDTPGYDWLAFCWKNFRFSASRSNRLNRNLQTGATDGKGSWFPLLSGSPKAHWDNRCEKTEKPVILDPVEPNDVRLVEVSDDGRIVPSPFARSDKAKYRVARSCEILGLNLPELTAARLAVLRDMDELCKQLGELFDLVDNDPSGDTANSAQVDRLCSIIASMANDDRPYARTAQSFIARSEYTQLLTG